MKEKVEKGVSGVVIIRRDSAHLPLATPLASSAVLFPVKRESHGAPIIHTFYTNGEVDTKPQFISLNKYGPKLDPCPTLNQVIKKENTCAVYTTNIDRSKTYHVKRPTALCLDSYGGGCTTSVCPQVIVSSDSAENTIVVKQEDDVSRNMSHSPSGGHAVFGTTDPSGQPAPFRMYSSGQRSDNQLPPRTAESIAGPPVTCHARPDSSNYPQFSQSNRHREPPSHQPHFQQNWPEGVTSSCSDKIGQNFDHFQHATAPFSSHLAPPSSGFEQHQEFHGTSQLIGVDTATAIRPRHFSGGESAIGMQRKQQLCRQQQEVYHMSHSRMERTAFHGSAPFLSDTSTHESDIRFSDPSAHSHSKQGTTASLRSHPSTQLKQHEQHQIHTASLCREESPDHHFSVTIKQELGSTESSSMPSSARSVPMELLFPTTSKFSNQQAVVARLPEIQMTEMVSEAEQGAPWMSHTPDNLSPTVQIVQKLAQATVSDNRGQESPLTTCSSGNNSPRLSRVSHSSSSSVLHIPTPDVSPSSLSPTNCTKHKQRFIFPDVGSAALSGSNSPRLTSAPMLESAGLTVNLPTIKSDVHRWRHVSSGSSGDSSTTGDIASIMPQSSSTSSSLASPHTMNVTITSSSSSSGVTGSIGSSKASRHRFGSGDTDVDDTLIDSETGSSNVEDSESSREQSPLAPVIVMDHDRSSVAAWSSAVSPTLRMLSPSGRRALHRQPMIMAGDDDADHSPLASGEEEKTPTDDERLHPPKFKRRLHERYVSSLRDDGPRAVETHTQGDEASVKELSSDLSGIETKPVLKLEAVELDSDFNESSLPKSPRRSMSDDVVRAESYELSADEGDVFMEPISSTVPHSHSQRLKPRNQQTPLDLSRGNQATTSPPNFQSSSAKLRSSTIPDSDSSQSSPSVKFSPLFRSPHRLNFSPHGLMSPQSQSPLCSVPEGGRIFNFNTQSPFEGSTGVHSDTDIISPSPMSPRFFTFPTVVPSHSASQLLNPMSEVNRLAVSPRALYPTSPIQFSLKSTKTLSHVKWGENMSKRSLSDSDVAYQCPICGQVFPTNDNLAKHMAKHLPTETIRSSDNNKIHYCKVCDRSFSRSDMLTRHMRLHTGLKPYECMDCGQVFSRSDHLNTHKRTHTGEKPYRCPHCPYAACRRDMITRHMRTHTKRTPKRNRYLSVPDSGTSSTEMHASSASGGAEAAESSSHKREQRRRPRTCSSLSSIDSLDLETSGGHGRRWSGQSSLESQPPNEDLGVRTHTSTSSSHESEDPEEALLSPAQWHRKNVASPLTSEIASQYHSIDDDAFLAADPGPSTPTDKIVSRESSPHASVRGYGYIQRHNQHHHYHHQPPHSHQLAAHPPPLIHSGDLQLHDLRGVRREEVQPFTKSSSSSSSSTMSRES